MWRRLTKPCHNLTKHFTNAQPRRLKYPPNSHQFPPISTSSILGSCSFIKRVPIPPAVCANFYSPIWTRMDQTTWQFNEAFYKTTATETRIFFLALKEANSQNVTFHPLRCIFWVHVHLSRECPLPLHSVPNSHSPMRTRVTKTKSQFDEARWLNQIQTRQQYGQHEWPNQVTIQRRILAKTSTHNASKRGTRTCWMRLKTSSRPTLDMSNMSSSGATARRTHPRRRCCCGVLVVLGPSTELPPPAAARRPTNPAPAAWATAMVAITCSSCEKESRHTDKQQSLHKDATKKEKARMMGRAWHLKSQDERCTIRRLLCFGLSP